MTTALLSALALAGWVFAGFEVARSVFFGKTNYAAKLDEKGDAEYRRMNKYSAVVVLWPVFLTILLVREWRERDRELDEKEEEIGEALDRMAEKTKEPEVQEVADAAERTGLGGEARADSERVGAVGPAGERHAEDSSDRPPTRGQPADSDGD